MQKTNRVMDGVPGGGGGHGHVLQGPPATLLELPFRDMRAKRPPLLSFLLRWETLRRVGRASVLLTLDFTGVTVAILSALCLKAAALGAWDFQASLTETQDNVAFAYLLTVLLFARSGLYGSRAARPGLAKIVASLFQVMLVALIFASVSGQQFQSYYIFYGSLTFAAFYIGFFRLAYEKLTGVILRLAGYSRRAILVGTGAHIEAVAHALADSAESPVHVVGFISLTPRPDNGLRSLGTLEELTSVIARHKVQEVIIADPAFPQQQAVELVDQCHQRGVRVRVAPSTMEILIQRAELVPGPSRCSSSSRPCSRASTSR
jgi:FlaA1/EpsC-like NDP-sugar epimerase